MRIFTVFFRRNLRPKSAEDKNRRLQFPRRHIVYRNYSCQAMSLPRMPPSGAVSFTLAEIAVMWRVAYGNGRVNIFQKVLWVELLSGSRKIDGSYPNGNHRHLFVVSPLFQISSASMPLRIEVSIVPLMAARVQFY